MKNVDQLDREMPVAASQESRPGFLCNFLSQVRNQLFVGIFLVLYPGCNGCTEKDKQNIELLAIASYMSAMGGKNEAAVEQALVVESLWEAMQKSISYFRELTKDISTDFAELKEIDPDEAKEEILKHAKEAAAKIEEVNGHLDIIIKNASELRALGLRVNPGVVNEALGKIDRVVAFSKKLNIGEERDTAVTWSKSRLWVPNFIERKARRALTVLDPAADCKKKFQLLQVTLYSLVDGELEGHTNNSFLNIYIEVRNRREETRLNIGLEPPASITLGLKFGDTGPSVKALQRRLISFGYLPQRKDSGNFDSATKNALIAWQGDQELFGFTPAGEFGEKFKRARPADLAGTVTPETLETLVNDNDRKDIFDPKCHFAGLKFGLIGPDVKAAQKALIDFGNMLDERFLPRGSDDGEFGTGTVKAVKKFERKLNCNSELDDACFRGKLVDGVIDLIDEAMLCSKADADSPEVNVE